MTSYSKSLVLILGTCLLATACAKKTKSKRAVGHPNPAVGAVGQRPGALPGMDTDEFKTSSGATPIDDRFDVADANQNATSTPTVSRGELPLLPKQPQIQVADGDPTGTPADAEPVSGGNNNEQCATAYRANNEMWFPGLPNPPSVARICTGHGGGDVKPEDMYKCEAANGYLYTDGRQDGLMAKVADDSNRLPKYMHHASRSLSRRILDVQVDARLLEIGTVNILIELYAGRGADGKPRTNKIRLKGNMRKSGRAELYPSEIGPKALYEGELKCMDIGGGCENAILRLDKIVQPREEVQSAATAVKGKKVKGAKVAHRSKTRRPGIGAVAYVVLRHGDAHVTMSDQERLGFRNIPNQAHAQFAQYLSNTVNNTCLNVLADLKGGARKVNKCAYQRLIQQCGRSKFKQPAATDFILSSWAVIYGQAGFSFSAIDNGIERLSVRGPLVASNAKPMWSRRLEVGGRLAQHLKGALLVANDGGGNLNLQLNFAEGAQTRFSVTSISDDVRMSSQSTRVSESAQVPTPEQNKLAEQRDVEQELMDSEAEQSQEDDGNVPQAQVAPPLPAPAPEAQAAEKAANAAPAANAIPSADSVPQADDAEQGNPLPGTEIAPPAPAGAQGSPGPVPPAE